MKRMPRWNAAEVRACLCLFLGIAAGCDWHAAAGPPAADAPAPSAPPVVRTVAVALHSWPTTVRVQGSLVCDEEAVLGTKVAGRVEAIHVDRGTPVQEGQVLVELEPEEFALRVQLAEAQVNQVRAKLGLRSQDPDEKLDPVKSPPVVEVQALLTEERLKVDRVRNLIRQSAAAAEEAQRQEAALRVAEARYASALNAVEEQIALLRVRRSELALARQQQADAVIRAPFAGVVQARHVARGMYMQPGAPVVTLVRTDPLRFRCGVPEREARHVQVQEAVHLFVEGHSSPIPARVTRISPALTLSNRSLTIEADVPNPDGALRAGLFAQADIVVDHEARTVAVPAAAVTEFAGVEKVWLVRHGKAEERRVQTGRRNDGLVEILSGLAIGDVVVADASQGRAGPVQTETR